MRAPKAARFYLIRMEGYGLKDTSLCQLLWGLDVFYYEVPLIKLWVAIGVLVSWSLQ